MEEQKKILILGGNYSTVAVVNYAHELGFYVIVTSNTDPDGEAKQLADETLSYSSSDYDSIVKYIKENRIDGVMTGASEFHILNMIRICKMANLPVYATEEQWNICQNKQSFKKLCREYGVPCVQEFSMYDDYRFFDYPIIVKPTDGCSARGISVCQTSEAYENAKEKALSYSKEKKIIVEKFLENNGTTMSVRYIAVDGELYLEAVGDRYVLDSNNGKALITAAAFYPSKYTDFYIEEVDEKVKTMFKALGLRNGVLFMESIANSTGVWFYEMGLRISGGMTYKITEQTNEVNELKMLVNYAATGKMCSKDDIAKINPFFNGYFSASITIPLEIGVIKTISGVEYIKAIPEISDITQYWHIGDTIQPKYIGTLDQLFARISIVAKGKERLSEIILDVKLHLSVKDINDKEMIIWTKLDEIYSNYIG